MEDEEKEENGKKKKGFWKKYGLFIQGIIVFGALGGIMIYFMVKG